MGALRAFSRIVEGGVKCNKCFPLFANLELRRWSTSSTESPAPPLTKERASALVMKLTDEERSNLLNSLQMFKAEAMKEEYRGQLAAFRWRSKFGRPCKVPNLGEVDPTGSYCSIPEDWLMRKCANLVKNPEAVSKPTPRQLVTVSIHNAVPFVGFGFLDNFIMIVCGDYIEASLGSMIVISTMAAAALGNTFSDILGLGSAYYVESLAGKIGVKPPDLSPIQLDMPSSRTASNLGRIVGVTIGCLLGMFPLLFMDMPVKGKEESS